MGLPRVLFLHANSEDYLADSLLHGLRLLLGSRIVDVPRRDALYDRQRWMLRAFEGEFQVIVMGDIWRHWAPAVQVDASA